MSRLTRKSLTPLTTTSRQHPLEENRVAELERQVASMQDDIKDIYDIKIKGIKSDLSGFGRTIRSIEERLTRISKLQTNNAEIINKKFMVIQDSFSHAMRSIDILSKREGLELRPSPIRRVEERRSSKPGPLSGE